MSSLGTHPSHDIRVAHLSDKIIRKNEEKITLRVRYWFPLRGGRGLLAGWSTRKGSWGAGKVLCLVLGDVHSITLLEYMFVLCNFFFFV